VEFEASMEEITAIKVGLGCDDEVCANNKVSLVPYVFCQQRHSSRPINLI
jgi:hypothetical protein